MTELWVYRLWDQITAPHPSIRDRSQINQARFYAAVSLFLVAVSIIALITLWFANNSNIVFLNSLIFVHIVGMLSLYGVSRTRYFAVVGWIIIGISIIINAVSLSHFAESWLIFTMVFPLLTAALLVNARGIIITTGIVLALTAAICLFVPGSWGLAATMVMMLLMIAALLIISKLTMHRRYQRLLRSEARLHATIEGSTDYLIYLEPVDDDLVITQLNENTASIMGFPADKLIGVKIKSLPDRYNLMQPFLESCFQAHRTGEIGKGEMEIAPGHIHEYRVVPLEGGVAVFGRDLTHIYQAEQRRAELDLERRRAQLVQDFVLTISHDLFTPLSIIGSSSYIVRKKESLQQDSIDRLLEIDKQAKRVHSMIEDMIRLTQLENPSDEETSPQRVDLASLVRDVVVPMRTYAGTKMQTLNIVTPNEAIFSTVTDDIKRAVANIVENAIKYTPEGGNVDVSVRAEGQEGVIKIADDGIGIPEEQQPLIFDKFYRGEEHRSSKAGMGLGLAIAKRAVENHQGTLEMTSAPDVGTTFTIRLPLLQRTNIATV